MNVVEKDGEHIVNSKGSKETTIVFGGEKVEINKDLMKENSILEGIKGHELFM